MELISVSKLGFFLDGMLPTFLLSKSQLSFYGNEMFILKPQWELNKFQPLTFLEAEFMTDL